MFIAYLSKKDYMDYAACVVPAAPVRKKPSHKVEMVNQLLFGECVKILKVKNKWFKVRSLHDNYEGWIRGNLIINMEESSVDSSFVTSALINAINVGGFNMHIPAGSTLPALRNGEGEIGSLKYRFDGRFVNRNEIKPGAALINQLTGQWMNAPYLWGGRTPLGVDCSGFVQVIFKMMGVDILRDAKLQATQGLKINTLQEAQSGDLAFFRHKKRKITHVGILLGPSQIVHASGKVRIDPIDEKGIIHSDLGNRTHSLVAIRRLW